MSVWNIKSAIIPACFKASLFSLASLSLLSSSVPSFIYGETPAKPGTAEVKAQSEPDSTSGKRMLEAIKYLERKLRDKKN